MITIRTCRTERDTAIVKYKEYRCTTESSISLAMEEIREAKSNNDLNKYYPIQIVDVFET